MKLGQVNVLCQSVDPEVHDASLTRTHAQV